MTEESLEVTATTRTTGIATEMTPVQLDHCYAKPWNWRQELAHCRPVRTLFTEQITPTFHNVTEQIDVDSCPVNKVTSNADHEQMLRECEESERKLLLSNCEENSEEWEENVKRDGWTPLQHRIFNKVVKMLTAHRLHQLASGETNFEAVQRKIANEGAAKKLRIILSSVGWDAKVTQWLHLTLMENLSHEYLKSYITILQTLRTKVPSLVDRLLNSPLVNSKLSSLNSQIVNHVVEKPWEPSVVTTSIVNKLPVIPLIVMVPSGYCSINASTRNLSGSRRFQTWHHLLQSVGKVEDIALNPTILTPQCLPLPLFVEAIIGATIQKIQELKASYPSRPIFLAGLQQGSLMAAQVAYLEPVSALICLGFPIFTVDGKRGEPDDFILDIRAPTMMVIGQSSSTCTIDGIEQLRHRMKAESSLLVVDGATDSLRMLRFKKKQQNVTQTMVDASILEEIGTFVTNVVTQIQGKTGSHPVDRKCDSSSTASGPASKRVRLSADGDESTHMALSGHNYSQNAPFAQPMKGRGGTGLSRVRGGRAGAHHSRANYQRNLSSDSPHPPPKGRVARSMSSQQAAGDHLALPNRTLTQRAANSGNSSRRSSPTCTDGEMDAKSNVSSSHGSPKDDTASSIPSANECKGGDSSETESAPPADDEEDILEDLRFCNELLKKMHLIPS